MIYFLYKKKDNNHPIQREVAINIIQINDWYLGSVENENALMYLEEFIYLLVNPKIVKYILRINNDMPLSKLRNQLRVQKIIEKVTGKILPKFSGDNLIRDDLLKFKTGVSGGYVIKRTNGIVELLYNDISWMKNDEYHIQELQSQYEMAYGDVLIGGLGLGVIALLVASKKEVSSVTVIENSKDVINLWNNQDFDKAKISIIHEDIYTHKGKYDVALYDYYNINVDIDKFIENEKKKLSNIISKKDNFYKESLVYKELSTEVKQAIYLINKRKLTVLSKGHLYKLFIEAEKIIKNCPYLEIDGELNWDYAMYRLGDSNYLNVGLSFGKYSIKVQDNKITDLYEIYKDEEIFSAEVDLVTKEVKVIYPKEGSNKIDKDGNLLQINHLVNSFNELPTYFQNSLLDIDFPFIEDIFYWANKPYGDTVEFGVKGLQ